MVLSVTVEATEQRPHSASARLARFRHPLGWVGRISIRSDSPSRTHGSAALRAATSARPCRVEGLTYADRMQVLIVDGANVVAVVAHVEIGDGRDVAVITADRALRDRVQAAGARSMNPSWLLDQL